MATVKLPLGCNAFAPAATNGALRKIIEGTNFPILQWWFEAAVAKTLYTQFTLHNYGSGDIALFLPWYAVTAASGTVIWEASLAAITPDTDSQDVETKAFATLNTVTDTHLGTTNKRLHRTSVVISNTDSAAAGDEVWLRLKRNAGTMTGYAALTNAWLEYSDT